MKCVRNAVSLVIPLIAVVLLYAQLATAAFTPLPAVEEPAGQSNAEVIAQNESTTDVVDLRNWEETVRKSGRRR